MKRLIAKFAAVLFLAAALIPTIGVATATEAGACGWYVEKVNQAVGPIVYSSYNGGGPDQIRTAITTYNDGCGNKQYASQQWMTNHTPATYVTYVRVWVCGFFDENDGISGSAIKWSSVWDYGACPRQADNNGSYAVSNYFSGGTGAYVNQG